MLLISWGWALHNGASVSCHPGMIMMTDVFGRFLIIFHTIAINLAHKCLWGSEFPLKFFKQFKIDCRYGLNKSNFDSAIPVTFPN